MFAFTLLAGARCTQAQQADAPAQARLLTVGRIYSAPSLNGNLLRGIAWAPDGTHVSFLETKSPVAERSRTPNKNQQQPRDRGKKEAAPDLWIMDAASGERRVLVPADRLQSMLPANPSEPTQATGLGRHAPADYQWAPDGASILFQGATALVWYDLKTQTPRTLVSGKAALADTKISPDGKFLSFVRDHNLWVVHVTDGRERALTQGGTQDIRKGELDWVYPEELEIKTAYWWAPDSSTIAFLEMDERKVAAYPLVNFASFNGAAEMERYPPAGGANPVVHVLVVSLSGGEPTQMDTGAETDIYIPRVNWLPDSKHVAIQRLNRAQTVLDLIIADAATGKARNALTEKDQYWINVNDDLTFLQDSKRFVWSSERSGYRHLYLYDLEGKELAQLTKGEWQVEAVNAVGEKAGVIYFTATEKSPLERQLYRVGLDGSGFARITQEAGTHAIGFPTAPGSPSGVSLAAFVDTYSNAMTPPRQDLLRADGTRIAAIHENKVGELAGYHLSPVEFLQVKSHDGVMLNASIIKPPNFNPGHKYPVLVFTYGGPHAQIVLDDWGRSTFLWHQMMAQKGYIIFSLDNRGSAGRGHLFEEPIHYRLGAQELSDQRDGAAYLKALPYVDPHRIGIWGWSYGGHMTLHAMFEDPEDFKAGFAGGPVTDWHYYDTIYTERYLGLLPVNEEYYQESSPIAKVKQLKGKLLIAHGTGDDNVHFANTLALLNELIEDGKYVEVLPFPGRGHGVSDLPAQRVLMERVTRFFLDNL
ncbi:MAG: S9 family peptidase [Acidobacteriota bacterium]|nr:S9 family peptidase [Acidobacteriota bacterium]